nr:unnamed protein product [Callosobruchus chinensis]
MQFRETQFDSSVTRP